MPPTTSLAKMLLSTQTLGLLAVTEVVMSWWGRLEQVVVSWRGM